MNGKEFIEFANNGGLEKMMVACAPTCAPCGKKILGVHNDEINQYTMGGKPVHEDCYFADPGWDEPIYVPHRIGPDRCILKPGD